MLYLVLLCAEHRIKECPNPYRCVPDTVLKCAQGRTHHVKAIDNYMFFITPQAYSTF